MYKSVLTISLVSFLVGCAAQKEYYTHKDHGVGNSENPHFVKDRNECKKSLYANGIISEGKRITNPEEIESLENEYDDWIIKTLIEGSNSNSGAYANAGASAAIAVTSGNTSGISNKPVESKYEPTPEKYKDIERLRTEVPRCINAKGWVKK
jgi:hypothetical protein